MLPTSPVQSIFTPQSHRKAFVDLMNDVTARSLPGQSPFISWDSGGQVLTCDHGQAERSAHLNSDRIRPDLKRSALPEDVGTITCEAYELPTRRRLENLQTAALYLNVHHASGDTRMALHPDLALLTSHAMNSWDTGLDGELTFGVVVSTPNLQRVGAAAVAQVQVSWTLYRAGGLTQDAYLIGAVLTTEVTHGRPGAQHVPSSTKSLRIPLGLQDGFRRMLHRVNRRYLSDLGS